MKRIIVLLMTLVLLAGCKSTLKVTNKSDPRDFDPITMPGGGYTGTAFAEIIIDVPEEVSSDEFDIARADIFADVFVDTFFVAGPVDIDVDLYIGLQPGQGNLSDPALNQFLTSVTITGADQHNPIEIINPDFLHRGLKQDRFYVKILADVNTNPSTVSDPELGVLRIDDIYFEAYLERETEGLFPIFYMF